MVNQEGLKGIPDGAPDGDPMETDENVAPAPLATNGRSDPAASGSPQAPDDSADFTASHAVVSAAGPTVAAAGADAVDGGGPRKVSRAQQEEVDGTIEFRHVAPDKTDETMILLTGLKNIYQKQLPNMPKEYIARLVYDRNHLSMAVVRPPLVVVGGITYRAFPARAFAEIVFCAISSTEQVKGYGARLMSHVKDYVAEALGVRHFLTYADNFAIGYFKKQGFTPEITLDRPIWVGYIKDYEGGTLMQCTMVPRVKYLNAIGIIEAQQKAVRDKIRSLAAPLVVLPSLKAFEDGATSVKPDDVPGLVEAGWSAEAHRMSSQMQVRPRGPLYTLMKTIVTEMQDNPNAWPFVEPVSGVADYYDIIKEPMDISTLTSCIENDEYKNIDVFVKETSKIFNNCRIYNEEGPTPSQESLVVTSAQDATAKAVKVAADSSAATVEQGEDADLEMGDFEDQWMDEEEGEDDDGDVIVDPGSDAEEAGDDAPLADDMQLDSDKATRSKAADNGDDGDDEAVNVYLPGQKLEEGEVLVPDNSVYEMLHQLHVEWPCLSFDFLKDNLGINRKTFPMTCYLVAGSQAEKAKDNKLYVMKMSDLYRTKHDTDDDMDEDSGDEDLDEDPVLEHRTIPHNGGVNRVRVMPHPDAHHVVSSWSENGRVYIWDVTQVVASLDVPGTTIPKEAARPIYTVEAHNKHEGFAMDWTGLNQKYRLLTGDVAGLIYQTSSTPSSFTTEQQAFRGHTGSVEDIQWSPSEDTVFASCSSDKTVRIWDTRTKKKSQIAFTAHDSDVNVISWNRYEPDLLMQQRPARPLDSVPPAQLLPTALFFLLPPATRSLLVVVET
ncbi:histone acetyltransferase, partial [Cladochytrium tenue]